MVRIVVEMPMKEVRGIGTGVALADNGMNSEENYEEEFAAVAEGKVAEFYWFPISYSGPPSYRRDDPRSGDYSNGLIFEAGQQLEVGYGHAVVNWHMLARRGAFDTARS